MAAIFGFQIVLTLITASALQKLSSRYSFGRWLLCRKLFYCLFPTNDMLKAALNPNGLKSTKKKTKADRKSQDRSDVFSVPKDVEIPLLSVPVKSIDVLQLPYYVEYRWLIDFTCYTSLLFAISEIFTWLFPIYSTKELNLSVVWVFICLAMAMKSLAIVTALYFRGLAVSGERSLCLSFGSVCFLITMVIFLISDSLLDIGLLDAHQNFTKTAAEFLEKHDLHAPKERSPILLYFLLSLMFGFLASFLTFPCLRYSRMYSDALRCSSSEPLKRFLVHVGFFSPLFVLVLWIKPLAHDHLVHGENAIFTLPQFESFRLWACLLVVLARFLLANIHLQAYLNIAYDKVNDLRNEGGRITNIDLQKMIAQIFYYLCVVSIQYFAPFILILSLTFILKVLGQYAWLDVIHTDLSFARLTTVFGQSIMIENGNSTLSSSSQLLAPSVSLLRTIFNVAVNRAAWNFFLFSTIFINFFGSLVGVIYTSKFKA